ncbi:hypothetical protein GW17_00012564 [Ensete ventricosum]|nr:hypothetical protein GW17_00012564 [Ensete ventricosum]
MISWSPPLRDGAVPEGSTSLGVAPTGVAYAYRHRACMCRPCPWVVVLAGSSIGCRRPWPQLVAPAGNQATAGLPCRCLDVGGRPYRGHGHGRPPLQVAWPWLAAPPRYIRCKNVASMHSGKSFARKPWL